MKKHHATLLAPVTASQSVPPPPPRVGASLVLLGEFLVLFGGAAHETGAQGGVLRLSAHSRTWAPLPSLPHPRYDHLALAVARAPVNAASGAKRSHMLVFGGAGNDGNLNDLWFLDADSLDWINSTKRMKGSVPSPRTIQSCAYLPGDESTADRIFIYGGGEGGGKATDDTRIHCLDIDTLTWTHVKTCLGPTTSTSSRPFYIAS
ncbi:hypothetical protein BDR26DRAFT_351461 [Obelidium mucronatum]|nr:hypothetical protein BDR26DRAFT_351461 [Obelidium mucronatum]